MSKALLDLGIFCTIPDKFYFPINDKKHWGKGEGVIGKGLMKGVGMIIRLAAWVAWIVESQSNVSQLTSFTPSLNG